MVPPKGRSQLGAFVALLTAMAAIANAQVDIRIEQPPHSEVCIGAVPVPQQGPLAAERVSFAAEIEGRVGSRSVQAVVVRPPWPGPSGEMHTLVITGAKGLKGTLLTDTVKAVSPRTIADVTVQGGGASLRFMKDRDGGLPWEIRLGSEAGGDSVTISNHRWNDRVYSPSRGGWMLRQDRTPQVSLLYEGPLLTILRVHARYCNAEGTPDEGGAEAVYDWYVFRRSPLVYVQSFIRQKAGTAWDELHQLEFNVPDDRFASWVTGPEGATGRLTAEQKTWLGHRWGGLLTEPATPDTPRAMVGLLSPIVRIYDGRGEYGTYVHGPWEQWRGEPRTFGTWLWLGYTRSPEDDLRAAWQATRPLKIYLTTRAIEARLARQTGSGNARWVAALARQYLAKGNLTMAERLTNLPGGAAPPGRLGSLLTATSGDFAIGLDVRRDGLQLVSVYDRARGVEMSASQALPLFRIRLRKAGDGTDAELTSDSGWSKVEARQLPNRDQNRPPSLRLSFSEPIDQTFADLSVVATAQPREDENAWAWTLRVNNSSTTWGIEWVAFPQLRVKAPNMMTFHPNGPGVLRLLQEHPEFRYDSVYPSVTATMQYLAAYSDRTGVYLGVHDPEACIKTLRLTHEQDGAATLGFDVPAPDMGKPGVSYVLKGEAVWRLLRGDWYDAALIYRSWVRKQAAWFPVLGPNGRRDTPEWMKRLSAWACTGGSPSECVEAVKTMQRTLGVPIGFHWYNWHQIPFDNDYPHYFPTRDGVAEAVADLQRNNVYVMPYINGRLWDTRDRGTEDWQFTSVALPAATKQRSGEPYVESYGSRETDGSPVRLAVMCPTTSLWQDKVRGIVLRLMNEVGTKGVYIDQIAAAAPVLCMDPSHGHPLGGGNWWTVGGYWPMLRRIRAEMPPDCMITTECTAEPYTSMIDAFLSWDWQADGMVPALPAVYGGAVQYFGRNYSAGASTREQALCMKMGQQLVFGEQIGWLAPAIAQEQGPGSFLRLVVRTRHRFIDYFAAGDMARPPRLSGNIPTVRADWAWFGETWVTTPAILTGAWRLERDQRLILIFVNVSDQTVRAEFKWNAAEYGLQGKKLRITTLRDPDATSEPVTLPEDGSLPIELPGRSLQVVEFSP